MTLARLAERLEEEIEKTGKQDGRRFNSRSKNKMNWEISNIQRSIRAGKKRNRKVGDAKGAYTKEELVEYRKMDEQDRQQRRNKMKEKCEKKEQRIQDERSEDQPVRKEEVVSLVCDKTSSLEKRDQDDSEIGCDQKNNNH